MFSHGQVSYSHWLSRSVSVMQVNDELLQRLTSGKNLSPRLVIPRSTDTTAQLDYSSPPEEVENWLRKKGFSQPWVSHTQLQIINPFISVRIELFYLVYTFMQNNTNWPIRMYFEDLLTFSKFVYRYVHIYFKMFIDVCHDWECNISYTEALGVVFVGRFSV